MGRPKKTLDDLPKDWKDKIYKFFLNGYSKAEIAHEIALKCTTFKEFEKREKDFSATIKKYSKLSEGWWVKQGRENLKSKEFNPVLWYMNMKNRFGWKDKQEIKHDGSMVTVNIAKKESEV